jgi:hypothetical protein
VCTYECQPACSLCARLASVAAMPVVLACSLPAGAMITQVQYRHCLLYVVARMRRRQSAGYPVRQRRRGGSGTRSSRSVRADGGSCREEGGCSIAACTVCSCHRRCSCCADPTPRGKAQAGWASPGVYLACTQLLRDAIAYVQMLGVQLCAYIYSC